MGKPEVTLGEILSSYPGADEAFDTVVRSNPECKEPVADLLLSLANEPPHDLRYRPIPPGKVRKFADRLRKDADTVRRVNIQHVAALPADIRGKEYQRLPELLESYARGIELVKPHREPRPVEHRRVFEVHLVDLISGALDLGGLWSDKPEGRQHYKEAATLLNAAYAQAEIRRPGALKKLFKGKKPLVDADDLQKAYRRAKARAGCL